MIDPVHDQQVDRGEQEEVLVTSNRPSHDPEERNQDVAKQQQDRDSISVGDVVLFTKVDSMLKDQYTYGMVVDLEYGSDSLPRRARIKYRNVNENVCRETNRSVRDLVKINDVNDSDLMTDVLLPG